MISRRYQCRPSEFFALEDEYEAYCFDQVVALFAIIIESKIEAVPEGKGKNAHKRRQQRQKALFNQLLELDTPDQKGKFKDPMAKFKGGESDS